MPCRKSIAGWILGLTLVSTTLYAQGPPPPGGGGPGGLPGGGGGAGNPTAGGDAGKFGTVVSLGGQPDDLILDESRGRIYAVSSGTNRVLIYDYANDRVSGSIDVGTFPSSASMSMDNRFLYVANSQSSTVSIIDLDGDRVIQSVSVPARPEGIAAAFDGRVLITTQGSGNGNANNTLLMLDPRQESSVQVTAIPAPPPINTVNPVPAVFVGRPTTPFPGRLIRTPDGQFIIGMVAINQNANGAQTTTFVYEAASGTVLRNRTVTGQSTVLSISPDGTRFMAGSTLYDTATLNVIAEVNTANLPFPITTAANNPAITVQRNYGGSAFSGDGNFVFGAFNVAANNANVRPQADAFLVMNAKNLAVRLGLRMPESILGKIVVTSSGSDIFATSESGLIRIPVGRLFDFPIIMPETTQVFLSVDQCNKSIARAALKISNLGSGKLTFAVPNVTTALVTDVQSGLAPGSITFIMEPGRTTVNRQAGTNVFTNATNGNGAAINLNIASREAINFPNTIRVYMNYRQQDQRGLVFPVPTVLSGNEGLQEMAYDRRRARLYISNSGYNRVEIFDTRQRKFLDPIDVGQLPHSMAMTLDGNTLYVGNTGGESISIVDLDLRREIDRAQFPAVARNGQQASIRPVALGMALTGLQFVMSNGTLWHMVGNNATPRTGSSIINTNTSSQSLPGPAQYSIAQTPDGQSLVFLDGAGSTYLYDALADNFTVKRVINTAPIQSYYGPAAGADKGNYWMVNGLVLSASLGLIGGVERPGSQVIQFNPGAPGQFPQVNISTISQGSRHVASVFPVDQNFFVRMTLPVRQNITSATRDDPRPTIEMVDIRNGAEAVVAVAPENPANIAFATNRYSTPARQMVLDERGTAYSITVSGLSVIPLQFTGSVPRPAIASGTRGILNANNGTTNFGPGSFVTVTGTSLADTATATQVPLPIVLGGSCVTLSDVPLSILQTSPTQITAQIPDDLRAGQYVAQVRSLATAQQSDPIVITVQRPQ